MEVDYSLYLVTDRHILKGRSLKKAVEDAILGGVTFVQVREKDISSREFLEIALGVKEVTDYYSIPMVINDRVDIALACNADGVHVGQKDIPASYVRKIIGSDKLLGVSVESQKEVFEAEKAGADYLGIGTVFFTGSKSDINIPLGLDGLKKVCSSSSLPSVAIGGINAGNIKDIMNCGVNGAAIISAILGEEDIKTASERLIKLIKA